MTTRALPVRATQARVDLDAIEANVRAVARAVGPAPVWAVVKADGYGHGAVEVAGAALRAGAAGLCVALPQEAARLREAGFGAPVHVLGPVTAPEMEALARLLVQVTVGDEAGVDAVVRIGRQLPKGMRPLGVHLKVDTGMGRVGCTPGEATGFARALAAADGVQLAGVFTHLATADEDAPYAIWQLERFAEVRRAIGAELPFGTRPAFRAANSAAAFAYPEARLDGVRVGIGLYGYAGAPPGRPTPDLRGALTLTSRVSFVKRVPEGTAVSYGATHRTAGPRVLATVPAGYADGVRRSLTGLEVGVGGRRVPIVGRVTMDQLVVEGPEDWAVRVGDPVTLLDAAGAQAPDAAGWARHLGTIAYEVLTGITARVPRVYTPEGASDRTSLL